jgi:uncharacterized membrane protein
MNPHQYLRTLWDSLRTSLWFQPVLGAILGAVLAVLFSELDRNEVLADLFFLRISVDGSRAVLGAIATGMLTILGLVFSILMVALVLASQQFSPRILRNFIRDQAAQNVMALFIGVFVYSLILLARIHYADGGVESPLLSITMALVLTLTAVGIFIYFIDHITKIIRANYIMDDINSEVMRTLRKLPSENAPPPPDETIGDAFNSDRVLVVPAPTVGYLQSIDRESLVRLAQKYDVVIRVEPMIGDFVLEASALFSVGSTTVQARREQIGDLTRELLDTIEIGVERTLLDDPLFGIRQLVDIALKAVSPGINDPTTAVNAVDYLSNLLTQAARQGDAATRFQDENGQVRVLLRPPTLAGMLELTFHELRRYTRDDPTLTERLLNALTEIARATDVAQRHALVWQHAVLISRSVDANIQEPYDRHRINEHLRTLATHVGQQPDRVLLTVDEAWLAVNAIKIEPTDE